MADSQVLVITPDFCVSLTPHIQLSPEIPSHHSRLSRPLMSTVASLANNCGFFLRAVGCHLDPWTPAVFSTTDLLKCKSEWTTVSFSARTFQWHPATGRPYCDPQWAVSVSPTLLACSPQLSLHQLCCPLLLLQRGRYIPVPLRACGALHKPPWPCCSIALITGDHIFQCFLLVVTQLASSC